MNSANKDVIIKDEGRMYQCWICQGTGVHDWYSSEHAPDCNERDCASCPVQVPMQEPCEKCWGSGRVTYHVLQRQVLKDVKDNLRAIEILERYKEDVKVQDTKD